MPRQLKEVLVELEETRAKGEKSGMDADSVARSQAKQLAEQGSHIRMLEVDWFKILWIFPHCFVYWKRSGHDDSTLIMHPMFNAVYDHIIALKYALKYKKYFSLYFLFIRTWILGKILGYLKN